MTLAPPKGHTDPDLHVRYKNFSALPHQAIMRFSFVTMDKVLCMPSSVSRFSTSVYSFSSFALSICLATSLSGCAKTDSDNIKTKGISAQIRVTDQSADTSSPAVIEATLYSGAGIGGTQLELSDGDRLLAYVDGEHYTLRKADDLITTYYTVDIPNANVNTLYQVSFERDDDTSAPYSATTLPDEFEITTANNVQFYMDGESTITWAPQGDGQMKLSADIECRGDGSLRFNRSDLFADDGSVSFSIRDWIGTTTHNYTSCSGEIHLLRQKTNSVDPAFGEGGSIIGQQERTITVNFVEVSSQ